MRKIPKVILVVHGVTILSSTVLSPTQPPADLEGGEEDLRCVCVKTTPLVRPKDVSSLEVIGVSGHCPTPQMM